MKTMMKRLFLPVLASAAVLIAGCGGVQTVSQVNESYLPSKHKRLAILPFESKYADGRSMADSFLPLFMSEGFVGVDRTLVSGALEAAAVLDPASITMEQLKKMKTAAGVDVVVMGSIDAKKPGTDIDAVSLRAVDSETGDVLISASFKNEKQIDSIQIPGQMLRVIRGKLRALAKRRLRDTRRAAKAEGKRLKKEAAAAATAARDKAAL